MNDQKRITRPEMNAMAKERGMKGYMKLKRFELPGKARHRTSEANTEGGKEAEKGT